MTNVKKTEQEWRDQLTDEQYYITRQHGTERAFSGPHQEEKRNGKFKCVCCGNELFATKTKYDSGSGWPSFYQPITENAVSEHVDHSHMMVRTEVRCSNCEAHLGHVFNDGPQPTGLRYCMNGHALTFNPEEDK